MPPEDIRCAALTSQSLQVSWQPPPTEHCNGLLQGYKLTYEPVLDDNWRGILKHRFQKIIKSSIKLLQEMMKWKLEKPQL